MNNKLPVIESFYSLQGEGRYSGTPAYFIRLAECDIKCHWCDIKESWGIKNAKLLSIDEIIEKIPQKVKSVIITGGEPSLWNLEKLTERLKDKKIKIHIETAGTNKLKGIFDWICLSPKKIKLPLKENYNLADELKVIIHNKSDFDFALKQIEFTKTKTQLFLQAEWSKAKKMTPYIFNFILENPQWNLSLQVHKYLNIR